MFLLFLPQLLENSQLTLMEEWRGWWATFTIWAITAPQPLNSSEQHTRANLEFSSDFDFYLARAIVNVICQIASKLR